MNSIEIVILLVFNVILININEVSTTTISDSSSFMSKNFKLEGKTVDEYIGEVNDFWTDARLNSAVPKPLLDPQSLPIDRNISNQMNVQEKGEATLIQGTIPVSSITSRRAGYPNTVGKVYFVDGLSTYSCSASVVTSSYRDMIITAGHCIYSTTSSAFVTNFIFIPQYHNNTRPYGTWVARSLYAMSNWVYYSDFNSDVAVVLLYTLNSQHIQDVVGSQSIGFNYGHSASVSSFGYPVNYANTEIMTSCSSTKYFPSYSTYLGDALPCNMTQGCSGGPWFQSFSFSTLSGIQTSVNSFTITTNPGVMYGPYFGSSVQSLYNNANSNTGATTTTTPSKASHRFNSLSTMFIIKYLFAAIFNFYILS